MWPSVLICSSIFEYVSILFAHSDENITRTFGVNVLAHFWTIKAFLPEMIESQKGHIVTIGSTSLPHTLHTTHYTLLNSFISTASAASIAASTKVSLENQANNLSLMKRRRIDPICEAS